MVEERGYGSAGVMVRSCSGCGLQPWVAAGSSGTGFGLVGASVWVVPGAAAVELPLGRGAGGSGGAGGAVVLPELRGSGRVVGELRRGPHPGEATKPVGVQGLGWGAVGGCSVQVCFGRGRG